MNCLVIFGNSGSGKSTLARRLSTETGYPHLDLDRVAWRECDPPVRRDLAASHAAIDAFTAQHPDWIIEGCYASLISYAAERATQMCFLNPGISACVENCRSRPWEPEKYPSLEAQNENLIMLTEWVKSYETRDDEFSLQEHRALFDGYQGTKLEIFSNEAAQNWRLST